MVKMLKKLKGESSKTYRTHFNTTLDHLISAIPACRDITQELFMRQLYGFALDLKPIFLIAGFDPIIELVPDLARRPQLYDKLAATSNRVC